ncbi:MAG: hypothetical protein IPO88_28975 [Nannocystis sp.]|uniref:hypothetical protein n=1 Tax=Nannocystis sp. TaxID=1962667 RepID=UPI0024282CD3|nr:hypothetical protein [Nannocystis sp.]MBK9757464.1 hypothetical protein [Nannocystis sp.]
MMTFILLNTPVTPVIDGVRWIDWAAFVALGAVWLVILGMLVGIAMILRSKARGDAGWGDSPGL